MLNISDVGLNIAIIKPKKGKLNQPVITISLCSREECKTVKGFKKYQLSEKEAEDYEFQQIPFVKKENPRNILYVTGPSGSGKSYYVMNYIKVKSKVKIQKIESKVPDLSIFKFK